YCPLAFFGIGENRLSKRGEVAGLELFENQ
ncbi:uncharacterized protein METZ01_LOCUS215533, partial [marine metagenome]